MKARNRRLAPVLSLCAVLALGLTACGSDDKSDEAATTTQAPVQGTPVVTIDMTDYAYTVSGPMTQGGSIELSNSGKEFHVAALAKLKADKTLDQLRTALEQAMQEEQSGGSGGGGSTTTARGSGNILEQAGTTSTTTGRGRSGATTTTAAEGQDEGEGEGQGPVDRVFMEFFEGEPTFPSAFMGPGQSAELSAANLTVGRYGLICFVGSEGGGPPHFARGMIGELEVVAGTAPPAPTAAATYQIAPGQPIQGPATLKAGTQTLKIEAAAGSQDLGPALVKLNQGATLAQFDSAADELFAEDNPPVGAPGKLPGQIIFGALSLGSVTSFYVTADFTPGTYAMVAEESEAEDAPSPPKESITITVS